MTALRKSVIAELEKVPDEQLDGIIQFITELVKETKPTKNAWDLDQFVMPPTERGQNADMYVRGMRDNDRI